MKFTKMLGLLAIVATATMAFAGIASATTVTSPAGTLYTGTIKAASENGHLSFHGSNGITIECAGVFEGKVESHGAAVTAESKLTSVAFTNCTNGYIVHVKKTGSLIAHATSGGNATLTSSLMEVELTLEIFGAPISCIYTTSATDLGTVTGSSTTGGNATLDISATIPRTGGSSLCGSTATWTGAFKFSTPATLNFDA